MKGGLNITTSKNKRIEVTEVSPEEQAVIEKKQSIKNYVQQMNSSVSSLLKVRESLVSQFDPARASLFFQNPEKYEDELRGLSNYFYNVSSQYRLMINYMANLPTFSYDLDLIGNIDDFAVNKVKKKFLEASQYVDKLNLRHEMSKVLQIAYKEDVFYGYEREKKDSFFIQQINPKHCRISSIEDGAYNFAFDFSYFSGREEELEYYPTEFKQKYAEYKANPSDKRWLELDSNKTICIKVNQTLPYILPPFSGMFEAIFDLDEYKKLKKAKTKMDNFLLLVEEIPMGDTEDLDNFLIDIETAMFFHNKTAESLPDGVALATSPMKMNSIRLERNASSQRDTVNDAISQLFTDSGTSQFIFSGGEKSSSVGISKSIMKDEQTVFNVMRQIERWLNRKLKRLTGPIKFKASFIDMTHFSKDEEFERSLKAAQYGVPNIMRLGAIQGMSPNQLYNKAVIENDILGLHDLIKPLTSSHTQSGNDSQSEDGGRPQVADDQVADSTESWRESNDSRND